jgi:SAM-dependent methyltransferase
VPCVKRNPLILERADSMCKIRSRRSVWHGKSGGKVTESRYTDGTYLKQNPDWHASGSPYKARWIFDLLSAHGVRPNHVYEVGCGVGEILFELRKLLPQGQFAGFEISPQAFGIAREKADSQVTFYLEDLTTSDRPSADLLLVIDVFEHVPDYMGFITALKDRAEYKMFHIPLDLSVQGMLRGTGMEQTRRTLGHLHSFYKETALSTLTDCGYEIVGWRYTHGAEQLPNRKLRTKLLSLPRKIIRAINPDFSVRLLGGSSMMVLTR